MRPKPLRSVEVAAATTSDAASGTSDPRPPREADEPSWERSRGAGRCGGPSRSGHHPERRSFGRLRCAPVTLRGRSIVVTGAGGRVGFPIARDLAATELGNTVYGVARFSDPGAGDRLRAARRYADPVRLR